MGPTLITGFPGFISRRLLDRLIVANPQTDFVLLVERRFEAKADSILETMRADHLDFSGNLSILVGDITLENLGLDKKAATNAFKTIQNVWHLAAIYDLAVEEEVAYRVNVSGTKNVLDFCENCKSFQQLNYVSTCFVAGQRIGRVYEDELDEGQAFNNNYESTKFWAEMEVQRRWDKIPSVIMRPSIVVGDAQSGETEKYDGLYYLFKFIKRAPRWAPFPQIGNDRSLVNIIPIDFALDAMLAITESDDATSKVFQVADPNPMQASEIVNFALKCLGREPARGNLPPKLIRAALKSDVVEDAVGIPEELVNYFTHEATFDTRNSDLLLKERGIACPHLTAYMQTLVDYYELHPDVSFQDGRRV